MNEFKMTPEEMQDKGGTFINDAGTMQDLITELNGMIEELKDKWTGGAATSFISKYEELKTSFQEMQECVGSIGEYLKSFGEEIQQIDESRKVN